MQGTNTAHASLPDLRMRASSSCVVLNKYYDDSVEVFSAFTGFLCSLIKQYFCMNAIIFECSLLSNIFLLTRILVFLGTLKVTVLLQIDSAYRAYPSRTQMSPLQDECSHRLHAPGGQMSDQISTPA
jgi:hypothetical protein